MREAGCEVTRSKCETGLRKQPQGKDGVRGGSGGVGDGEGGERGERRSVTSARGRLYLMDTRFSVKNRMSTTAT